MERRRDRTAGRTTRTELAGAQKAAGEGGALLSGGKGQVLLQNHQSNSRSELRGGYQGIGQQ